LFRFDAETVEVLFQLFLSNSSADFPQMGRLTGQQMKHDPALTDIFLKSANGSLASSKAGMSPLTNRRFYHGTI